MASGSKSSSLNLSLLSRGIGEVKKNGHERIDVFLEPQDYFNYTNGGMTGRRRFGHLPALMSSKSGPCVALLGSEETSDPSKTTVMPKTFTTRKGALLLFSEDLVGRMRRRSKTKKRRLGKKALHPGKSAEDDEDEAIPDLERLEDLTNAILTYGNCESGIHLKFIRGQRTPRPIRPGYSAKRYLSRLTRAFDEGFLETLLNKGFVSEKTLFTSNSLLPHLRRRIDDDLSHTPAPYRILRQMLTGPGVFSGFSFFSDASEGTFLLGQLGKREKDGDALKVVQMKNGVETPVNYQGLSQVEKENALADILVKSAIEQVLEIHKQNITFPAVEEEDDSNSTGRSSKMSMKTLSGVNMVEAVRTYLRGSHTDRYTLPNASNQRWTQIASDQQTASDDLYASDPSTVGDSFSFTSSRRSSIGLPVGTSGPRGQSDNRQNKMTTHPVRVMTPIIDSRMASREVTLDAIQPLPPITVKTGRRDRETLPKSDDKVFEKVQRDEEEENLSGVLTVGGLIQTAVDADAAVTRTFGPLSIRSFGSFKGGLTQRNQKKTIYQKPALKGVGGPTDGSVVMMPGGELIQVGRAISIANIDQKKRPAFGGKGALPSDALLIQRLAEGARNLASLVLSNPETGQDLSNDALRAAELWMSTQLEMPEDDDQAQKAMISTENNLHLTITTNNDATNRSVAEYRDMLTGTLLNVVSRLSGRDFSASPCSEASISPELMDSLLTRTVHPKEITVVDDAAGRSVITVIGDKASKNKNKMKTISQSSTLPSNEMKISTALSVVDVGIGLPSAEEAVDSSRIKEHQQMELSKNLSNEQKSRETAVKSDGKTTTNSDILLPSSKDAKKSKVGPKTTKEKTEEGSGGGGGGGGGGASKPREFVVGKVEDKSELGKLYGQCELPDNSNKLVTKKKKKKKNQQRKGETESEIATQQSELSSERHKKNEQREGPSKNSEQKRKTKAPFSMEERSEDVDFIFASETYSDDEPIVSPRSRISNATVAQSTKSAQLTDEEANQPSYFSDTSSSSKTGLNKLNRAAEREAKAELRRQEVQRKRRQREEQLRREKEEAERMEQMVRDLEEERLRKEEARRLERERMEESRRRREEERLARERRAELEAERERRMKDEYMKKLEEMKRQQEEEARLRAELEEKMRLEEAEKQRLEQLMLAKMEAEEREQYLRMKMEEEERLRKLQEEEKRRRLEEQQRAAEEAMRMAQEIARRQAELQRRLEFNRSLHSESGNLSQSQAVTRAFVFSYLELLQWLSLDHPSDNAQTSFAAMQETE